MLRIHEPFHGAVLNSHHGRIENGALHLCVTGDCPKYGAVTVNGVPARIDHERFEADIALTERENDIVAVYDGSYGHQQHSVRVLWDQHSFPRYRFSIDDNSFFLRDIARKGYDSIWDCFYLDMLRTLNREYGTKFTLNIYFDCQEEFGQPQFLLPDFPDRYRGEWEACADWLGLTFHAYANRPDRPYQYAAPQKLMSDMAMVEEQILRFAGPQTLILPTVIHWGIVIPEALPALYEHGVRVLSGYFSPSSRGYEVHYWLDEARSEYLWTHDAMMHWETGLAFSHIDMICNGVPIGDIVPKLEATAADPNHAEIMDLFTHEQYFFDFYSNYVPDHAQRLDTAIRWVTDHGYKPVFFHKDFLGAPA